MTPKMESYPFSLPSGFLGLKILARALTCSSASASFFSSTTCLTFLYCHFYYVTHFKTHVLTDD